MSEFKLIVAGGRDYNNADQLATVLFDLAETALGEYQVSLVSGMARGADRLAYEFAKLENVKCYEFVADWDKYGKAAGYRRNADMGDFADGLLAFWNKSSKGTEHMIKYMEKLGKPVHIVYY